MQSAKNGNFRSYQFTAKESLKSMVILLFLLKKDFFSFRATNRQEIGEVLDEPFSCHDGKSIRQKNLLNL